MLRQTTTDRLILPCQQPSNECTKLAAISSGQCKATEHLTQSVLQVWQPLTNLNQYKIFFIWIVTVYIYIFFIALFHIQPLLPYCPTVWNWTSPPQHINTTLVPDSCFQTTISVVSSDNALRLSPSPAFPFFTAIHTCGLLGTCSFNLRLHTYMHITCSSVPVIMCLCFVSNKDNFVDSAMCLE